MQIYALVYIFYLLWEGESQIEFHVSKLKKMQLNFFPF